jgi:uncharacterized membrane protein YqaE (UPF0057 family)
MILIAIIFPGISFLLRGKILSFILCIILQATLIGWLPAAIWAVVSYSTGKQKKELQQMEARIMKAK